MTDIKLLPLPDSLINDPEWETRALYTAPPAAQVQQEAVSLIDALDPSNLCHATGTPEWPLNCECPKHATHPAADALGAVRELVAKWRDAASCLTMWCPRGDSGRPRG